MKGYVAALKAEFIKNKNAKILWITFAAFALVPLMGGIFMIVVRNPETLANAGALKAKAEIMNFSASWISYFGLLTQAIGVAGVLMFGFVASWVFGREYSEGTAKDLMALPTSRAEIINTKFIVYGLWCIALVISNMLLGYIIGSMLQISPPDRGTLQTYVTHYFITTALTVALGTPIAFFALWGKGYLAPLGFVVLVLVFSQIITSLGYGTYFPWAVPGLFSGIAEGYRGLLNEVSYLLLFGTSLAGYLLSLAYWKYADHTK